MKKIIYIFAALMLCVGCITNDLPYPVVVPHITAMDVEDADNVEIDFDNQIVTVYLQEHKWCSFFHNQSIKGNMFWRKAGYFLQRFLYVMQRLSGQSGH